jgi:DNA polymerase-3 subunit alpha
MPQEYAELDIAKHILELCKTPEDLQRVAQELLLFQEQNLFPLLCYLKYLVDTMREHSVVWGVGRGSSVASYVLYIIGVHKINPIKHNLDWREFLR